MTFEEAKKILEKEFAVINLHKSTEPFEFDDSNWFGYEKPSVLEAFRVLSKEGYYITISGHDYDMRKKRLEKEYEKNTKAPGPGEEQPEEKKRIICCSASPKADFYYKHVLDEGNPALAESAAQFNDALLDEQAKKIEELTIENERLKDQVAVLYACKENNEKYNLKQIKRLGKEIARLNKIIHKKNLKIEELGKESSRHLEGKMKMFGENFDLKQELKDKDVALAGVAEGLRLSKIREKNLTELCQKYIKANEKLKEKLANNVVDKIDAQALKSAESVIAYKDEVIETLDKELAEAKHELSSLKRPFRPESTEAVVLFANAYAKAEKKHLRCAEWRNDGKEVSITYILKNGKKSKITLDFTGDEIIFSRTDPDKKPRIPAPEEPKHDNIFEDFINKTIDNYNRRAANLGCVGSKDGNGIFDQMVGADIAEEGGDLSGVIVLCGKDFIDAIKKMK